MGREERGSWWGWGTSVPHLDFRQPPVNRHVVDFASKKKKKILAVGSIEQGKLVSGGGEKLAPALYIGEKLGWFLRCSP